VLVAHVITAVTTPSFAYSALRYHRIMSSPARRWRIETGHICVGCSSFPTQSRHSLPTGIFPHVGERWPRSRVETCPERGVHACMTFLGASAGERTPPAHNSVSVRTSVRANVARGRHAGATARSFRARSRSWWTPGLQALRHAPCCSRRAVARDAAQIRRHEVRRPRDPVENSPCQSTPER
jgi:hypothetical protein